MRRRIPARMALLACSVAVIPQTVAAASDAREPAQIFASTCGWCHHKGGREAGKGPRLLGTSLSDAEIAYRVRKGRQGYMPAFEGAFSDAEMNALVAYIRNLRP